MREPANKYKVQKKIWSKWSPEAKKLFNELYSAGRQEVFAAGMKYPIVEKNWDVIRWNFAWMAASMASFPQHKIEAL